jgi:hypothetical protein
VNTSTWGDHNGPRNFDPHYVSDEEERKMAQREQEELGSRQLADAADIEIARDAADDAERNELPLRAGCIRACAYSAEVASELLHALENLYALVQGECPSLLEDDHHDVMVSAAIAKGRGNGAR